MDGIPALTPWGVPGNSQPMTLSDIDVILEAARAAADVAVRDGFDAVEIHAAHGYLLDEFVRAHTNRRSSDRFGGGTGRTRRCRGVAPAGV